MWSSIPGEEVSSPMVRSLLEDIATTARLGSQSAPPSDPLQGSRPVSGYTPVFRSVFTGSLYGLYPDTAAWLFLLALADKDGRVDVTPEYIAGVTGMPVDDLKACIARFLEPDPASRTTDNEGRRLELIDPDRGWGWRIINHAKYRERARKRAWDAARTASGADAARKRASRAEKRRSEDHPDASRRVPTCPGEPVESPLSNSDTNSNTESSRKRTRRSRFAPEDFEPTVEMISSAKSWGLSDREIAAETAKFKDHEFKDPKKDWKRAWNNWMRRASDYRRPNTPAPTGETTDTLAAKYGLKRKPEESDHEFERRVCDADIRNRYPQVTS